MQEKQRICALERYEIFGTDPEPTFDRIANLAAEVLNAPIAIVSFIGKSDQWLKARKGIDTDRAPRNISFCSTLIDTGGCLFVEDLASDERFNQNPYVLEGGLRAYGGYALKDPDGQVLGSIAVSYYEPHQFTQFETRTLEALAAIATDALEMRLLTRRLDHQLTVQQGIESELGSRHRTGTKPR